MPVAVASGCDNNWQTWWIGSRTQWNVTKDFYMGVDVLYSKLIQRNDIGTPDEQWRLGNHWLSAGPLPRASDVDNWAVPLPRPPRLLSLIA